MAITPLKVTQKLAGNPSSVPKYGTEVARKNGQPIQLGDPKATRTLVALMNQHAVIGGAAAHWGGPAAMAEMMSAIHGIMFADKTTAWYDSYNFVNDAGHTENGVYALRANYGFDDMSLETLKGFRSIDSKLTGHGEAHLNPEGVYMSNGPLGSGLPQAQGLALADKLIGNNRVTVCTISDGASMEGEAKESFSAIPGMAKKGKLNPFVMAISDNNTKLSGRIDDDSFDMNPSFASLEVLGWRVIKVEDGHNLEKVLHAWEDAIEASQKDPTRPTAIWLKTIKGYGIKATEESASGGHGYPLKPFDDKLITFLEEIYNDELPDEFRTWGENILKDKPAPKAAAQGVKKEKIQVGVANAAIAAAKRGAPVFSVTADLAGSTGIAGFHKEFPDRYVDVGVAESNMINVAAGLSKQGFIPFVDTFAQFGVTKGNLPITMANLSLAPVIALFSHTGFQDAADGASHQATTYISAVSSIPHTTVINLSCSSEADYMLTKAIEEFEEKRALGETPDSYIFFLGRENFPQHYGKQNYSWREAQVLKEGTQAVIVASGSTVPEALEAARELQKDGYDITVINNAFINHPDVDTIATALEHSMGNLVTVEDHQTTGGMGSILVHALAQQGIHPKTTSLGIDNSFGQSAYKAAHLYKKHGLDCSAIKDAVRNQL